MNSPLVSICLPNLNTFPYLEERVETIYKQTYENWELVVSDNYSEDGAWQFFQRLAEKDPRVSIAQAPREGLYPNWNNCIRRAQGKYVYIATSDDTMADDCLEKQVRALEDHPDCDIAHCPLVIIDENGVTLTEPRWPECTEFWSGIGEFEGMAHVRRAPYDGLLHMTSRHVILSITQIMIRRTLFAKTGPFLSKWGSVGDFNWELKAGLVANMVHVPDTWASWRLHSQQATAAVDVYSPERDRKFEEMVEDAFATCAAHVAPAILAEWNSVWRDQTREMRRYYAGLRHRRRAQSRRLFQLAEFCSGGSYVRSEILGRLTGKTKWTEAFPSMIREWLEQRTAKPVVTPLTASVPGREEIGSQPAVAQRR